jgi:hypothetical protein
MKKTKLLILAIVIESCFLVPGQLLADEQDDTYPEEQDSYQNPYESITDANGLEINDWLKAKLGLEFEKATIKEQYNNQIKREPDSPSVQLMELEFDMEITDNLSAIFAWESEKEDGLSNSEFSEKILAYELDDLEITLGRFDLPFAIFNSHFISGPLLEFAETLADSVSITFRPLDKIEVQLMLLDSKVDKASKGNEYDTAIALRWFSDDESLQLALGYFSDLAESDEQLLLDEDNIYQSRVGVFSFFVLYAWEDFELTFESIRADDSFIELDQANNKPSASNLEFAWYPQDNVQLAWRFEQSDELEDAPESQLGMAIAWRPYRQIELAAEYLKADYKQGFVTDDDDNILRSSNTLASRLRIEF